MTRSLSTYPASYVPSWFTVPMGTGILALVLVGLPGAGPVCEAAAVAVWLIASVALAVVATAALVARRRDPGLWRRQHADPVLGHFVGAAAMAVLSVAAGTGAVGHHLLGVPLAHGLAMAGWAAGTALGCWSAVAVPVAAIRTHSYGPADAAGWWLMPVVPPLVSAATGAALIPWLPAGQAQQTMLVGCLAAVGVSGIAGLLLLSQLWGRLLQHGPGPVAAVPTLWIPLGFLGQSVTAVHHLLARAPAAFPSAGLRAGTLDLVVLALGLPVWGFGLLWLAIVAGLTRAARREGLTFSMSWWAFTFPVATMVTATAALADVTGLEVLDLLAWVGAAALVGIWAVVATRTAAGIRDALARRPHHLESPRARLVDAA